MADTSPLSETALAELSRLLADAARCPRLSEWETEFLDAMREKVATYGKRTRLSPKQREVLEKIEHKVYGT